MNMRCFLLCVISMLSAIQVLAAADTLAAPDSSCAGLFRQGSYSEAADCYGRTAYTLEARNATDSLLALYPELAASLVMADKPTMARAVFAKLLAMRPDYEIDPNLFQPDVIAIFQMAKMEQKKHFSMQAWEMREPYPLVLNFVPGGLPQYKNTEKTKGVACLLLQGVALGLSIYGHGKYTSYYSERTGFREEDVPEAKSARRLYLGGFFTFVGLYILGTADGIIHRPLEKK
jgi:hypothetical protein